MSEQESTRRRSNLGRGLQALFGEDSPAASEAEPQRPPRQLPIESLVPNPYQPRRNFDEDGMKGLVESVRQQGILQPILVRPIAGSDRQYQIVAGERRWRAAQQARLHEVPVVIRELTDRETLQIALVENIQRQDLTAIEEGEGYRRLIAEFAFTQEDLGRTVGKSRSHVANTLRLLDLPEAVRAMVQDGRLTAGHARALLGCADPLAAAHEVLARGLNVRQTEALARQDGESRVMLPAMLPDSGPNDSGPNDSVPEVRDLQGPIAPSLSPSTDLRPPSRSAVREKDADTLALEREMSNLLGFRVTITPGSGQSGTLSVHYGSLEQLDHLLHRLSAGQRPL